MKKTKCIVSGLALLTLVSVPALAAEYHKTLSSTKSIGPYNYYSLATFVDRVECGKGLSRFEATSPVMVAADGYIWNDGLDWLESASSGYRTSEAVVYIDFSDTVGCQMVTKHYAPSGGKIEGFTVVNSAGYMH